MLFSSPAFTSPICTRASVKASLIFLRLSAAKTIIAGSEAKTMRVSGR